MPRLLGVDIPPKKKIAVSLCYIYGIGPTRANLVVKDAALDPNMRAADLTEEQLNKILHVITDRKWVVEGKTVTGVNLVIEMARDLNGKNILLIDADMRKGRVAQYLGLDKVPGLAEILKGEVEPDATFVSPNIDNLTIIPSGKAPKNPAELLGSKKMKVLLESLRARFDYIFIDSPPVMLLTDPCILGAMADGVIMIAQAGRTQREIIKHAQQRLAQAHANVLGFIVTNVEYHLPMYLYRYVNRYSDENYIRENVAVGV